jgi:hypothetical protein
MAAQPWFQSTCLLLIDIQTDFWSDNAGMRAAFPHFPLQIATLLRACRAAGIEVCHVLERANAINSAWHSFWMEMNPGEVTDSSGEAEGWAAALGGEQVFYKHSYDAVGVDCGLEAHLKQVSPARCLPSSCDRHQGAHATQYYRPYLMIPLFRLPARRSHRDRGRHAHLLLRLPHRHLTFRAWLQVSSPSRHMSLPPTAAPHRTFVLNDCCADRSLHIHNSTLTRENKCTAPPRPSHPSPPPTNWHAGAASV